MRISLPSIHTEQTPQQLAKRIVYVIDHLAYFDYVQSLLDRAALPHCDIHQPNLTSMSAMVAELQELNPTAPWLNGVILGRVLNRTLPRLVTWHGVSHVAGGMSQRIAVHVSTTTYRFCEVGKARKAFELFVGESLDWSNDFDQWQSPKYFRDNQLSY
jgi:hypothetical protein